MKTNPQRKEPIMVLIYSNEQGFCSRIVIDNMTPVVNLYEPKSVTQCIKLILDYAKNTLRIDFERHKFYISFTSREDMQEFKSLCDQGEFESENFSYECKWDYTHKNLFTFLPPGFNHFGSYALGLTK